MSYHSDARVAFALLLFFRTPVILPRHHPLPHARASPPRSPSLRLVSLFTRRISFPSAPAFLPSFLIGVGPFHPRSCWPPPEPTPWHTKHIQHTTTTQFAHSREGGVALLPRLKASAGATAIHHCPSACQGRGRHIRGVWPSGSGRHAPLCRSEDRVSDAGAHNRRPVEHESRLPRSRNYIVALSRLAKANAQNVGSRRGAEVHVPQGIKNQVRRGSAPAARDSRVHLLHSHISPRAQPKHSLSACPHFWRPLHRHRHRPASASPMPG
jgi:hypothetical protein